MQRVLEPEVMDTWEEAIEYDAMDFTEVNLAFANRAVELGPATAKVLDVGTGTARIPILISQQRPGWQITGIDLSENMLKVGKQNVEVAGLQKQIQLALVDAKKMPYPDNSFDVVISNSIVHHLPDPFPCFVEIKRVLKPQGAILLRDLLRPSDPAIRDQWVEHYAGQCNPHQKQLFRDSLQAAFTLEEIAEILQDALLSPLKVYQSSDRHWTAERRYGEPGIGH